MLVKSKVRCVKVCVCVCLCACVCESSKLFKMLKKNLALKTLTHPRERSYAHTGTHTDARTQLRTRSYTVLYLCVPTSL